MIPALTVLWVIALLLRCTARVNARTVEPIRVMVRRGRMVAASITR